METPSQRLHQTPALNSCFLSAPGFVQFVYFAVKNSLLLLRFFAAETVPVDRPYLPSAAVRSR